MTSDLPTKALSIRQPWAWAIVSEGKDVENRDWSTKYRGPVCIHASKGMSKAEYDDCLDFIDHIKPLDPVGRLSRRARFVNGQAGEQARGGIVGVADLVDCVEDSDSPWFMGRYGFVLKNVRAVKFIPVKGMLGFFEWRARIIQPAEVL